MQTKQGQYESTIYTQAAVVVGDDEWEEGIGWTVNPDALPLIAALLRRRLAEVEQQHDEYIAYLKEIN